MKDSINIWMVNRMNIIKKLLGIKDNYLTQDEFNSYTGNDMNKWERAHAKAHPLEKY